MPTVPSTFVPQVNPTTSNTQAFTAPAVAPMRNAAPEQLQELGDAMQRAGSVAYRKGQQVQMQIQSEVDDANVKAAETKLIQMGADALHGEKGYLNRQGADALNGYDETAQSLAKAKQEILDSLGNGVQKRIFEQVAQQHLATFGSRMSEHRAKQRKQYTIAESINRSESMRVMAQNSEIGSREQNVLIETGIAERGKALEMQGIAKDSEPYKTDMRNYRTQVTKDNVNRLITAGQFTEAKTLFDEQLAAGNLDPDVANQMRPVLYAKATESKVLSFVDENWKPGMSIAEFDSKIVATFHDPDERKQARMEWRDRESAYEADREKQVKAEIASIWGAEMKGTSTRKLYSMIDSMPTLDDTQRKTLKKQVEDQRKPDGMGEAKAQAWAVNMIPYLTDPSKAASLEPNDIAALAPKIGPSNVMFLSKIVGELQSTNTFPVPQEILNAEISKAGWDMKDSKQAQLVKQAYANATDELLLMKKNGKSVDRATIEKTLRVNLAGFQTVTEVDGGLLWFDKKGKLPIGAMTDQQIQDAFKELPTSEVKAFSAYTQSRYGVSTFPNQTQFLRAFKAWKDGGMPQAPQSAATPTTQELTRGRFGSIQ